ncbi:hypothetical protein CLAFUW4_13129 [Fulvia fulva]|uniref:Uncharacterized protein n=1 Tax=Passalora fulva TaxID=5499 RepID=A0A9Q8PJG4_PASFU|nr:uncharacterized protein CLAFUR5_12988 [Fulvia fulva]KAK4611571.1 hypothetical protein CLAFUR4_13134 [Fulvia fulva]KAK4612674.1 hypothetical protein CLAFUR0_13138 [Fulvia fulva]UJO23522.1 hypothetical protein CLAFUR5_12988 [Fulvia fulva]WPV20945.1 hypothetical protein CLAFUW4_13129 [Fulvia fulva]WPV36165.1 hypothetical protein CLAFUW7_13137 [Fulvia fulva]
MSLKEAYHIAHSAQCRLQIEASRPDRNLRFLVGHLMHYESMRLRIVEIEHDVSKYQRASAVRFQGTGHVDHTLQHKPSTGQLGRRSPPPPQHSYDSESTEEDDEDDVPDDLIYEDDDAAALSLERFPSRTARVQTSPTTTDEPDLVEDQFSDDDESDEPHSPEDPDQETLAQAVKGDGNELLASMYEGVRKCSCHGKSEAPSFSRMWELPPDKQHDKEGITRAVAQISDDKAPQMSCTAQAVPVVA